MKGSPQGLLKATDSNGNHVMQSSGLLIAKLLHKLGDPSIPLLAARVTRNRVEQIVHAPQAVDHSGSHCGCAFQRAMQKL
jgi:hypothetical protein